MKILGILLAAIAASVLGCSVHSQAPIKEVAYDFSDYDHYDRPFGQSPTVGQVDEDSDEGGKVVVVNGASDPSMVSFPCNRTLDGDDEEITCYFHHRKGKGASTSEVQMINGESANTAPASSQPAAVPIPVQAPPAQPPIAGPAR